MYSVRPSLDTRQLTPQLPQTEELDELTDRLRGAEVALQETPVVTAFRERYEAMVAFDNVSIAVT